MSRDEKRIKEFINSTADVVSDEEFDRMINEVRW